MRETTMKLTRRILMGAAAGSLLLSGTAAMAQQTELTFWSWRQEDRAFEADPSRHDGPARTAAPDR